MGSNELCIVAQWETLLVCLIRLWNYLPNEVRAIFLLETFKTHHDKKLEDVL